MDRIRDRFGADAIGPASLICGGEVRNVKRGWQADTPNVNLGFAYLHSPEEFVALFNELLLAHQPGVLEFSEFLDLLDWIGFPGSRCRWCRRRS